jgi:hypothetical protein
MNGSKEIKVLRYGRKQLIRGFVLFILIFKIVPKFKIACLAFIIVYY